MRVLLTGHTGYLGHHLVAALRARGCACVTAGRRDADVAADLDDPGRLGCAVAAARPDVVLHAAAMSSMAACAADPDAAARRNGDAVGALAAAAPLVMVSTDLVFDGRGAPYRAGAVPRPLSAYGRSKVRGERLAVAAGGLVVRVPLLFGPSFDGTRGATDMLRAALARGDAEPPLRLYTDEFRTPLHVRDAADALVELTLALRAGGGVVHLAGPERVSRFELAERFAARHRLARAWRPASSTDPARPPDVSLVSDREFRPLDAMLADA